MLQQLDKKDSSAFGITMKATTKIPSLPEYNEMNNFQENNFMTALDEELERERKNLSLFEKFKHKKWQLRRDAFIELTDIFTNRRSLEDSEGNHQLDLDNIGPWLQTIINDQHMLVFQEGLKAINAFIGNYVFSKGNMNLFISSLIDKLVITKSTIIQLIYSIFEKFVSYDDNNIIPNEILKRLDNKNFKFLNSLLVLLNKTFQISLNNLNTNNHHYIDPVLLRQVFKGILPMVEHTNKEIRMTSLEIIKTIYSLIEENYEELQKGVLCKLRNIHVKELEILKTVKKIRLNKAIKLIDNNNALKMLNEPQKKVYANEQKIDLLNMLPEKFLELPYLKTQNDKLKKLEALNQGLSNSIRDNLIFDINKDYTLLINLLTNTVEEQNILINMEALKALRYLMKILSKNFPQAQIKHMIVLIIEKFKGNKKTNYNTLLYQIFDECIIMNCLNIEIFLDIIITNIEINKNNSGKIACINWLNHNFIEFITVKRDAIITNLEETQDLKPMTDKFPKESNTGNKFNQRPLTAPVQELNSAVFQQQQQPQKAIKSDRITKIINNISKKIQAILKKELTNKVKASLLEFFDKLNNNINETEEKKNPKNICDLSIIKDLKFTNDSVMSTVSVSQENLNTLEDENKNNNANNILIGDKNNCETSYSSEYLEEMRKSQFVFEKLNSEQKENYNKLVTLFADFKPHDDHLLEKFENLLSFLEKISMDTLQACQEPLIRSLWTTIKQISNDRKNLTQIFEQLSCILVKINRICLELAPKSLHIELKIILLFIGTINSTKTAEKIIDSAYMTCSIDKFLAVSIKIFQKIDQKYSKNFTDDRLLTILKFYLNWLCHKLDKIQNCILDEVSIKKFKIIYEKFKFTNFPQIHQNLVNSLCRKIKSLDESSNENSSTKSFETPNRNKAKLNDASKIQITSFIDNESNDKDCINTRIKAIENELKQNFASGLERMKLLMSSIKKKVMEKNLTTGGLSSSPIVSPNRHWKRGVGREGALVENINQINLQFKNNEQAIEHLKFKPDEIISLIENISLNITDKDLPTLEIILNQVKLISSNKDNLILMKSIITGLYNNASLLEKSKPKVLLIMKNYSEGMDKLPLLNIFKQMFIKMIKTKDIDSMINVFSKLTLEFILYYLYNNEDQQQMTPKHIQYMVEIIVYSLSVNELKPLAENIINNAYKIMPKPELFRIFELELINSSKLYQIFVEWIESQNPINVQSSNKLNNAGITNHAAQHLVREEISMNNLDTEDYTSNCDGGDNMNHDENNEIDNSNSNIMINSRIRNSSLDKHQVLGNKASIIIHNHHDQNDDDDDDDDNESEEDENYSQNHEKEDEVQVKMNLYDAMQSSSIELSSSAHEQIKKLNLNAIKKQQNQQVQHPFDYEIKANKKQFNYQFNLDFSAQKSNTLSPISTDQRNPLLLINSNTTLGTANIRTRNLSEKPENSKIIQNKIDNLDDSDEKWKNKFLQEKERLHQTIELLEKANHGYLNQVTEKVELVNKLENQRKINEKLIEKFNAVTSENEQLKQVTKQLEQRNKENINTEIIRSISTDSMLSKRREHTVNYLKSRFYLMPDSNDRNLFIQQFQELLLTSNNLELEIGDGLMQIYESFLNFTDKLAFIKDLKNSITHSTVLEHLSSVNHKFLIESSLKLCISENTQREILLKTDGTTFIENELTQEIQILLDALLRYRDTHTVIFNLLRILNDNLPLDFSIDLTKGQKMLLKLTVKCLVRISSNIKNLYTEDIKVFELLLELYKVFKCHPPENLREDLPSIKDYDIIYRNLKILGDHLIDLNPSKAKELSVFLKRDNNKSVFLDYISSYIRKFYPNI